MLTKELYQITRRSYKGLDLDRAEQLLKNKVKPLTPVTVEDIRECNVVDNYYQIDTDSFLYRADENSYYIEEVKEDGTSNIVKGGFDFVQSYIIGKTYMEYF